MRLIRKIILYIRIGAVRDIPALLRCYLWHRPKTMPEYNVEALREHLEHLDSLDCRD